MLTDPLADEPPDDDTRRRADTEPAEPTERAGAEVVEFPAAAPEPRRGRAGAGQLITVWTTDAADTARSALDGGAWRARPPALRDMAVRTWRAEWSGGWPILRWPGQLYGFVAAAAVGVLYAAAWVVSRLWRLAAVAALVALMAHLLR